MSKPISSDDPQAIEKIRARQEEVRTWISRAERANEIIQAARKRDKARWPQLAQPQLARLGLDAPAIEGLLTGPGRTGRYGFPYPDIVNARQELARLDRRVEDLERRRATPGKSVRVGPAVVSEVPEKNRLQVVFDTKPTDEIRTLLKGRAFRWAPSENAWQRHLKEGLLSLTVSWLREGLNATPQPVEPGKVRPAPAAPEEPDISPATREAIANAAAKIKAAAPSPAVELSPELQTWKDAPAPVRKKMQRAFDRARDGSAERALVAHGRRAYEIRKDRSGAWGIFDATTQEPAPFVARQPRRRAEPRGDRWSKSNLLRDADSRARRETGAKIKAKRGERGEALKSGRAQCRTSIQAARTSAKGDGRRVSVARAREQCATNLRSIEERFAGELQELDAQRPASRRRTKRPSEKRERTEERDQAVRDELVRQGRADLLPIWEQQRGLARYRGISADRAWERFSEYLQEDEDAQRQLQEQRSRVDEGALACAQAEDLGRRGDDTAAAWARDNCEDGRPKKGSAAERTLTMLDLPNPAVAEAAREAEKKKADRAAKKAPRRARPAAPGQQQLGDEYIPLVAAGGPQMGLGDVARRKRAAVDLSGVPF